MSKEITIPEYAKEIINIHTKISKLKNFGYFIYIGYIFSFFIIILSIPSVMLAYYGKKKAVEINSELLEQNFKWQIRTFWGMSLFLLVSFLLSFVNLHYLSGFIAFVWGIYRIVKGWFYLTKNKFIYKEGY